MVKADVLFSADTHLTVKSGRGNSRRADGFFRFVVSFLASVVRGKNSSTGERYGDGVTKIFSKGRFF